MNRRRRRPARASEPRGVRAGKAKRAASPGRLQDALALAGATQPAKGGTATLAR